LFIQHQMIRTGSEQGAEEWSCAHCSRRIVLRRPPKFEKIVLDRGDETVNHSGSDTGLTVSVAVAPAGPANLPENQRNWLAEHGIAWETDDGGPADR
jgi:hypothetical protein